MVIARMRRPLLVLLTCAGATFGCAFVFVVVLEFSLPPTDAAHGQGLAIFLDPFVIFGMIFYASIAALISFPLAWYCLKGRKLLTCSVYSWWALFWQRSLL